MDQIDSAGRSLPFYAVMPTMALAVLLLGVLLTRTNSAAARYVIFAVWLRLVMSALHEFTFDKSPIGLSWNALASIGIVGLSAFVLRRRSLFDITLIPIYPIVLVMVASGVYNHQLGPMLTSVTKFLYLAALTLAIWDALEDIGPERLLRYLFFPFLVPLTLQLLSVVLGASAGEDERSTSYIGGYNHEAVFSVCLLAAVLTLSLAPKMSMRIKALLVGYGLLAIILANYRTAILAAAPLVAFSLMSDAARRFIPAQRPLIVLLGGMSIIGALIVGASLGQDRFADFGVAMREGTDLIRPVGEFSADDERIMSGRPYIWSGYLYAWWEGSPLRKLIGFGPETWTTVFQTYAHNTVVSAIYEVGILGTAALLLLWIWMLGLACLAPSEVRARLLAAHLAFFILNMATMPMWQIEGMIYYGILCGFSGFYAAQRRHRTRDDSSRKTKWPGDTERSDLAGIPVTMHPEPDLR